MLTSLLLLSAALLAAAPQSATQACDYDRAILSLGFDAFDQDMKGGWRALASRPGCERKAADVIRHYREKQESALRLLYWHEGQLRASTGDSVTAARLMEKSLLTSEDIIGWNAYADATIAFLQKDKAALVAARARLAPWPKPEDGQAEGLPADAAWPPNLDVVDGLIACFEMPYKLAYASDCRDKSPKP